MTLLSRSALAAALAVCGVSLMATAPAVAQKEAAKPRNFKLSKEERAPLAALQTAVLAKDTAAATAALPAAKAAAKGADARFVLGQLEFQLGRDTNNAQLQADGVEWMIQSGSVASADLPGLYQAQASLALNARDNQKAEVALGKLMELRPNDPSAILSMAQLKTNQKKSVEAVALLQRAIAMQKASGQPVEESWYQVALKNAFDGKLAAQSFQISRDWLAAYPKPKNWRDAILIYRELGAPDKATELDALRLLRFTRSLSGERDFFDIADALSKGGYPGEVKAVLDEGISGKIIDGTRPMFAQLRSSASSKIAEDKASLPSGEKAALAASTGTQALKIADAYFGYGEYAKAITLYRAALQKGSVDPNLVNTRLGMALTMAGQKAEALAALKSITGPRAELASFLQIWLSQRA